MSHRHWYLLGRGPGWGLYYLGWQFRPPPIGTQELPIPTFSIREEVKKLNTGIGGGSFTLRDVSSCLLVIALTKFRTISGCFCSSLKAGSGSCLTVGEFIPLLLESLDPNSESSGGLPSMISMSSFPTFHILFPNGIGWCGVVWYLFI